VIEQRAVAVGRCLQLAEEVREQLHVVLIELREAVLVLLHVRVVRQRVERIADPALGVDLAAQLLAHQEGRHAGDLRLPRQHLQVVHQRDVLLDVLRHAGGRRRDVEIVGQLLAGLLDTPFDFADVLEILVEPGPVVRRQLLLQRRGFAQHRIEQAHRLRAPRLALGVGAAVAEQALEDHLRVVCIGSGDDGPCHEIVSLVRAAQTVAAVDARLLDHQFERGGAACPARLRARPAGQP
jgi:hypothetical protein